MPIFTSSRERRDRLASRRETEGAPASREHRERKAQGAVPCAQAVHAAGGQPSSGRDAIDQSRTARRRTRSGSSGGVRNREGETKVGDLHERRAVS
jgi:hypothetical protein